MRDSFDAFEYLDYLRQHRRVMIFAVAAALIGTLAVSLLLPKRYTATVRILIEPPGSNDVRTATAVSPVYLESLRSFETFAASDSLFAQAVERFHLQDAQQQPPLETLKRRVLKVSKLRDTRILEMSAILGDPKTAHDFIAYLADQTVALNQKESLAADGESIQENRKQFTEARARLDLARQTAAADAKLERAEALTNEVSALVDLQSDIRRQLIAAETDAAAYEDRPQGTGKADADLARQRQAALARAAVLRKKADETARALAEKSSLLSQRTARQQEAQEELDAAQAGFESAAARLRDLEASAGNRAERLRIVDPGIIPQRPSSPNVMLNVLAAAVIALVAAMVYLSVHFAFRERSAPRLRASASRAGIP